MSEQLEVHVTTNLDLIRVIEKDTGAEMISLKALEIACPELVFWAGNFAKKFIPFHWKDEDEVDHYFIRFCTETYQFRISVKRNEYLMPSMQSRKPRVGETWTRGNDLSDGSYSEYTWNMIMRKVVEVESLALEIELPE